MGAGGFPAYITGQVTRGVLILGVLHPEELVRPPSPILWDAVNEWAVRMVLNEIFFIIIR